MPITRLCKFSVKQDVLEAYFTKSASVRGCNGKLASREMSLSVTVSVCSLRFGILANGPLLVLRTVRGQHNRMICDWMISGR
jgi:hypothetical protein